MRNRIAALLIAIANRVSGHQPPAPPEATLSLNDRLLVLNVVGVAVDLMRLVRDQQIATQAQQAAEIKAASVAARANLMQIGRACK